MGMSSSQARLLSLTGRMHDIERKAQRIQAEKLRLANESNHVYEDYVNSLEARKLMAKMVDSNGQIGDVLMTGGKSLTYGSYLEQYAMIDKNGKTLVSESLHNSYSSTNSLAGFLEKEGVWVSGSHYEQILPAQVENPDYIAAKDAFTTDFDNWNSSVLKYQSDHNEWLWNMQLWQAAFDEWSVKNDAYQVYLGEYNQYLNDHALWTAKKNARDQYVIDYANWQTADAKWVTDYANYQDYLTKKAAHDTWATNNAAYLAYLAELEGYNTNHATWEANNAAYQAYLADVENYNTQHATWETNNAAYQAYLAALENYNTELEAWAASPGITNYTANGTLGNINKLDYSTTTYVNANNGYISGATVESSTATQNISYLTNSTTSLDSSNTYLINSVEGLNRLATLVNSGQTGEGATIVLTQSIQVNGDLNTIGTSSNPFKGTFDGNGYSVSNFSIAGDSHTGFFGKLDGATVKNLSLANCGITGKNIAGTLAAQIADTTIDNCKISNAWVHVNESTNIGYAGGFVGAGQKNRLGSTITNCVVDHVSVETDCLGAGGFIGFSVNVNMTNCAATGGSNVYAHTYSGGFIGESWSPNPVAGDDTNHIVNCSTDYNVSDGIYKGGFIGRTNSDLTYNGCKSPAGMNFEGKTSSYNIYNEGPGANVTINYDNVSYSTGTVTAHTITLDTHAIAENVYLAQKYANNATLSDYNTDKTTRVNNIKNTLNGSDLRLVAIMDEELQAALATKDQATITAAYNKVNTLLTSGSYTPEAANTNLYTNTATDTYTFTTTSGSSSVTPGTHDVFYKGSLTNVPSNNDMMRYFAYAAWSSDNSKTYTQYLTMIQGYGLNNYQLSDLYYQYKNSSDASVITALKSGNSSTVSGKLTTNWDSDHYTISQNADGQYTVTDTSTHDPEPTPPTYVAPPGAEPTPPSAVAAPGAEPTPPTPVPSAGAEPENPAYVADPGARPTEPTFVPEPGPEPTPPPVVENPGPAPVAPTEPVAPGPAPELETYTAGIPQYIYNAPTEVEHTTLTDKSKAQWLINLWYKMQKEDNTATIKEDVIHDAATDSDIVLYNVENVMKKATVASTSEKYGTYENENYVVVPDSVLNNDEWLYNSVENGDVSLQVYSKLDEGFVNTSVAHSSTLNYQVDETYIKKAEAKYEADMRRINQKDAKYDQQLSVCETERQAIKDEMETLKTVIKNNVEMNFKLFS